jgi:hypothetical protein
MKSPEIVVTSDPDREELFAELYIGGEQWGEVIFNRSSEMFEVTIFPARAGGTYVISMVMLEQQLREARQRLEQLGYVEREITST